ncbi:SPOR domain-containing protein [Sphingomonas lutea]|uniref:SPOR domain-containing protein n=1 Tax=Sphingomonas lutea TaxID=1045317 RepID=A0A7G9SF46_9SPHN|nr:SPOR domain-containing protein [Sphingomonas lutea]QNN66471.1 SPOR domain-containing protein [Sphingomonas lutea]
MSNPFRFASTASFIVLASMTAGCAGTPKQTVTTSGFGGKANGEIGYATRALTALSSGDVGTAINYAEKAVEKTPDDAGFRALLGNSYFAAGRFASAEAAYRDSLTIYAQQPQVLLKLALSQVALGKTDQAVSFLHSAQGMLDPADYGLALALAGRPSDAVSILDASARLQNADARVRQNLALAYALSGNWSQARIVAAQDVSADKLDARIQEWIRLANPAKPHDQVAALTGVVPAAVDAGQPVRLALRPTATRTAEAPKKADPAFVAASAPQQVAAAESAPTFVPPPPPPPVVEAPPPPPPPALVPEFVAASAPEAVYTAPLPPAKPVARKASAPVRKTSAVLRSGGSKAVVQLGSYRSPEQVSAGWATLTRRYPALKSYLPMRARFDSPKGTFWRLSIQGFGSQSEAQARCQVLKSRGGACFVRTVAGDAPVRMASR